MEFSESSFNGDDPQARDDDEKVNRNLQLYKDTMELIKKKMEKADTLIRQYNDKMKECDLLKDELSCVKNEKQDFLNKYNLSMERLTKLELTNLEYKKTIENYKNTTDNQKLKLDENEQHINQLHFKIKDMESQNSNLEDEISELKQDIKSQKAAQKAAEKKDHKTKSTQTIPMKMKNSSVNTDISGSLSNNVSTMDKKTMTKKSLTIEKDPFPLFCTKCETHINPPPVDQILKIMSTPPPLLSNCLSPIKRTRSSVDFCDMIDTPSFKSNINSHKPHSPIRAIEPKRAQVQIAPSTERSTVEIHELTKRLERLEHFVKKTKKKQSRSSCNEACSSKNIKFVVQMPNQEKLYEYRKREKRKKKQVKRLKPKKAGVRRKHTLAKDKWQVESQSESEGVRVTPRVRKPNISKVLKNNKFSNKSAEDLFESDEVNVPDTETNENMDINQESPLSSLSPSPIPFLQPSSSETPEETKINIDVINKSLPEMLPQYTETDVGISKKSCYKRLTDTNLDLDEIKNSPQESLPEEIDTDIDMETKCLVETQPENSEKGVDIIVESPCETLPKQIERNVDINNKSFVLDVTTIKSLTMSEANICQTSDDSYSDIETGNESNCQNDVEKNTVDTESEVSKITENKFSDEIGGSRESLNVVKQLVSRNNCKKEEASDSEHVLEILSQSDDEFEEANLPIEKQKESLKSHAQLHSITGEIKLPSKASEEIINNLSQKLFDAAKKRIKDSDDISLSSSSSSTAEPTSLCTVKETLAKDIKQKENLVFDSKSTEESKEKIDTSEDEKASESEVSDDMMEEVSSISPSKDNSNNIQQIQVEHQKSEVSDGMIKEVPSIIPLKDNSNNIQQIQVEHQKSEVSDGMIKEVPSIIPSKDNSNNIQQIQVEDEKSELSSGLLGKSELPKPADIDEKLAVKENSDLVDQETEVRRRHTLPISLGYIHKPKKKISSDDTSIKVPDASLTSDNLTDNTTRKEVTSNEQKSGIGSKAEEEYVIDISADQAFLNKFYLSASEENLPDQKNVPKVSASAEGPGLPPSKSDEGTEATEIEETSTAEKMSAKDNSPPTLHIDEETTDREDNMDFLDTVTAEMESEGLQLHTSSELDSPISPENEIDHIEPANEDHQLNTSSELESSLCLENEKTSDNNPESGDENPIEEKVHAPARRGRKRLSELPRASNQVLKQKKLLSKIRNIRKTSKKPMIVSSRPPVIAEKAEPSTSKAADRAELAVSKTPMPPAPKKIDAVRNTATRETIRAPFEIIPTVIPAKKQRIAHTPGTPKSIDSKSSESSSTRTVRKTRSNSAKPGDENDTLSSIMKDYEKTCKERIEINRTLKAQKVEKAKQLVKIQGGEKVPDIDIKDLLAAEAAKTDDNSAAKTETPKIDKEAESTVDTTGRRTRKTRSSNNAPDTGPKRELRSRSRTIDGPNQNETPKSKGAKSQSVESPEITEESKSNAEVQSKSTENDDQDSDILSISSVRDEVMPAPAMKKKNSRIQSMLETADEGGTDSDAQTIISISDEHPTPKRKKKKKNVQIPAKKPKIERIDETNSCLSDSVILSALNDYILNPQSMNFKRKHVNVALARKNEKFIRDQLKLLVSALMWTNDLNFQVIDSFLGFTDPKSIAFGIVEYLGSEVLDNDTLDMTFTPPAPPMTKMEQKILTLILQIEKTHPGITELVEEGLHHKLFRLGVPQPVQILERLFRILLGLCKIKKDRDKVRMFLCDAFYCMNMRAMNITYVALRCWPEVLPKYDANNDIIAKTIVHIIMTQEAINFPLLNSLRKFLADTYGYPKDGYMSTNFKTELMKMVEKNEPGSITAMLLLCKRKGPKWSLEHVVKGGLKQMIVYQTHPSPYDALTLLGNILRTFPLDDQNRGVTENIEQLLAVLDSNSRSEDLQEGVVSCLLSISKFKFEQIAQSVIKWQSNKELRPATRDKLDTFFKQHDAVWWRRFISFNFPPSRKD